MGWWFGRILTLEVVADDEPAPLGEHASHGAIACDVEQGLLSYAAYGRSIKAAIEPLVSCYGIELFDDSSQLRSPSAGTAEFIDGEMLGNSADTERVPRTQREQLPARDVPAVFRLSYYDPARDYQAGDARASAGEQNGNEEQQELPAVLDAADAKALTQQLLARRWADRDRLTLRLPPRCLDLEPGARIETDLSPGGWTIDKFTVDGLVAIAELRPTWSGGAMVRAVSSAQIANRASRAQAVESAASIMLFDVPDVFEQSSDEPVLLLAASSPTSGWRRRVVTISFGGQKFTVQTSQVKSVLGRAMSALSPAEPYLIDMSSQIEVELIDPDQWLTSCDNEALVNGCNLAVLGSEIIQFGDAFPLGQGRFRLAGLVRGRGGTEWAASTHQEGEPFVLLERSALEALRMPQWANGSTLAASEQDGGRFELMLSAESLRPLYPVDLQAMRQPNGDIAVSWTRRSRKGSAWIDEVDAPLGETREEYRVTLVGPRGSLEYSAVQPQLTIPATDVASAGVGPARVEVRQIGDWSVSRPAELVLNLSQGAA